MIRRPPRSTPLYSSAASDVYKRQPHTHRFDNDPVYRNDMQYHGIPRVIPNLPEKGVARPYSATIERGGEPPANYPSRGSSSNRAGHDRGSLPPWARNREGPVGEARQWRPNYRPYSANPPAGRGSSWSQSAQPEDCWSRFSTASGYTYQDDLPWWMRSSGRGSGHR